MIGTLVAVVAASTLGCADPAPRTTVEHADDGASLVSTLEIRQRVDTTRDRINAEIIQGRRSALVEAAALVSPAVVSVNVIRRVRSVTRSTPFGFLRVPRVYEREVEGIGSGFIVSADGIVITNQHVTDGAAQIVVTTTEGTDYDAELLGEDPLTDIAVLRVDASGLPTVRVGSSRALQTGEWVVAFGNPYGYLLGNSEPTVTAGVVSAVGRNILPGEDQPGVYVGMIQTDAAINPGNSGGPLVNAVGEVVGVNSSILSSSGGSVGIGFAIPVERALRVADELLRYGAVRRAWLGVTVRGAEAFRAWKQTGGLEITGVVPGSPAAEAGILSDDVLISAQQRPIRTFLDWEAVKLDIGPGDSLTAVVRRGARERQVRMVVTSLPSTRADRVSVLDLELISVTPAIQQERGLQSDAGALVYDIGDSAARATGLRVNDVVLQVNRQRIESAEQMEEVLQRVAGRAAIRVYYERDGRLRYSDFYVR